MQASVDAQNLTGGGVRTETRPRVIIVEDDVTLLSLLCQILEEEGWVVIPCPRGQSALSVLESSRPDVVLLDIRLDTPDRGWQILRDLRQSTWGQTLPVVICSGAPVLATWPDGLTLDGVELVSKPFSLDELVTVTNRCLDMQRADIHIQGPDTHAVPAIGGE